MASSRSKPRFRSQHHELGRSKSSFASSFKSNRGMGDTQTSMRRTKGKGFKKFGGKKGFIEPEPPKKAIDRDKRFEMFTELRETLLEIESRGPNLQMIIDM